MSAYTCTHTHTQTQHTHKTNMHIYRSALFYVRNMTLEGLVYPGMTVSIVLTFALLCTIYLFLMAKKCVYSEMMLSQFDLFNTY